MLCELASGLSVLCGGSRDAKAEAAFALYDYNGDGFISLEEMTRYLTCVFKVMYETQPGTAEEMGGASAEELAEVTAERCFEEADLDGDGNLTFDEFQAWYSNDKNGRVAAMNAIVDECNEKLKKTGQEPGGVLSRPQTAKRSSHPFFLFYPRPRCY